MPKEWLKMSANKTKILDPGLCRFCRSIKKCRLLTEEYEWSGKKEVYSDMIMDCFGLVLSYINEESSDSRESGVCANCVTRLRVASALKLEILKSEEIILQNKLKLNEANECSNNVKPEPINNDDVNYNSSRDASDIDDCSTDDDKEWKPKKTKDTLSIKPKKLLKKLKSKSIKDSCLESKIAKLLSTKGSSGNKKLVKVSKQLDQCLTSDDQYFSEDNLIAIVENSFVCPFKNRSNNFYCFYCKEFYAIGEDLRRHTWNHDPRSFKKFINVKKYYYIDITRIDCRLCPNKIDSIDELKNHISTDHSIKIHSNVEDVFVQFRITFTNLTCVVCKQVFVDFNAISKHMIEHYSNCTCDICGLCFFDKHKLSIHMKCHRPDEKHPCEVCGKIFKSKFYKDSHVDTIHNKIPIIKCPRCDEMFLTYAVRNKHLVDAHGLNQSFPCNLCSKVYNKRKTLTEHNRRTHMKVLKHQCEYCEQRFYSPCRLKEHMATHTEKRNVYSCNNCEKSYPRLKSLQEHLKSHDERSLHCHICGQSFVNGLVLSEHFKSLHPTCQLDSFF